ncbi:MAG: hypothetical protein ACFCVK_24705 [Acidimicrobiales bacterium]
MLTSGALTREQLMIELLTSEEYERLVDTV